jgi:hypoxanthine phosphoribosyltransferase
MKTPAKSIQIKDKKFTLSIPELTIKEAVLQVAHQIALDYTGKTPLFIVVLNGAFMFAADLMKQIDFPCEISFVKFSSYQGTATIGTVTETKGLNQSVEGRDVIIIEDIVDTGITIEGVIASLKSQGAKSISVAAFLQKPDALQRDVTVDYVALKVPNDFIVGYGLDYDGFGRNLKDIYTLIQ